MKRAATARREPNRDAFILDNLSTIMAFARISHDETVRTVNLVGFSRRRQQSSSRERARKAERPEGGV